MEENEYKSTYKDLTQNRCVFEKALTNHKAKCAVSTHFCLADREGYACQSEESAAKCAKLLEKLRENSVFVLKLREIAGPLPHNMEIRVQVGGLAGLAKQLTPPPPADSPLVVADISAIVTKSIDQFGALDKLPFREIIQSVVQFQGRRRRQRLDD